MSFRPTSQVLVLYLALYFFSFLSVSAAELINPESISSAKASQKIIQSQTTLMGTEVGILIVDASEDIARQAIKDGFDEIRRIENLMTDWRDSPFERINQNAGIKAVSVSDEIIELVSQAIALSRLTKGAFDISYAAVGRLWNFSADDANIPSSKEISTALKNVGFEQVQINQQAKTIFLPNAQMRIGLGGIAKGYAVERVVELLHKRGLQNFAVNAGGDLTVSGKKYGELWQVAIRHPRQLKQNMAVLPISNGTVVTSGDSERFFVVDDVRYSHILDPRTGYPANLCQSVTIVAKKASEADALATGVFVLGPEQGMLLIESLDGVEGLIVAADGSVHISSGLQSGRAQKTTN